MTQAPQQQSAPPSGGGQQAAFPIGGVLFALAAATAYGTSQVITRQNVNGLATPLVGTLIALFWGTLGFAFLSFRDFSNRSTNFMRGAKFFALAGLFSAMGVVFLFQALARGNVVIVSPIAATNALFTMFFAMIMLRGVEKITPRVLLGAALVVSGVVVLSVFK